MTEQKKKLRLDDIQVKSFVTTVDSNAVNGGTSWTTVLTTFLLILPGDAPGSQAQCDTKLDEVVVTP